MPRKKKITEKEKTEETEKEMSEEKQKEKTEEEIKQSEEKKPKEKIEESIELSEEKKEELKEKLKIKAEELAKKIKVVDEKDIKKEVMSLEEKRRMRNAKTLFPLDDYVKYSAHLGTRAVTPNMRQFVYKRRADGIAVLNTNDIDKKLKEAVEFLSQFNPEDIFLACKREAGWLAAKKFSEVTGIRVFTKKYPAGIITNSNLRDFFETELIIICDPWMDKNALNDADIVKKPVIALCDTNNLTAKVTKIMPCNNKSGKSIGLILYLLAREYLKAKKIKTQLNVEDFAGKVDTSERKTSRERGAREGV